MKSIYFTGGTAVVSHCQASVDELEINEVWTVRTDGFQGYDGRDGFKLQGCQYIIRCDHYDQVLTSHYVLRAVRTYLFWVYKNDP